MEGGHTCGGVHAMPKLPCPPCLSLGSVGGVHVVGTRRAHHLLCHHTPCPPQMVSIVAGGLANGRLQGRQAKGGWAQQWGGLGRRAGQRAGGLG